MVTHDAMRKSKLARSKLRSRERSSSGISAIPEPMEFLVEQTPRSLPGPMKAIRWALIPAIRPGRDDILSTAMVVPVGHRVHLHLRAQDVIHSLFIPAMRFKQDTVPGMEIHSHFTPTQIGNYEIACAELCGMGHYRMRAMVRVVSEEEFEKWLKSQLRMHAMNLKSTTEATETRRIARYCQND